MSRSTDKQVETQLKNLKKQYFGGSEKNYRTELKSQCVTDAEVRDDLRVEPALERDLQEGHRGREGDCPPT